MKLSKTLCCTVALYTPSVPTNTACRATYVLSMRLTVTWFYVPFVSCWQGHAEMILNVNWLDCHVCRQLYCQAWDEQRYLSYRHLLVSLLTPIGGEALSRCDFLALYRWCMCLGTITLRIPAIRLGKLWRKLGKNFRIKFVSLKYWFVCSAIRKIALA